MPLVAPPSSQETSTDSYSDELNQDTDFRELHAGGRRRRWIARGALLTLLAGAAAGAFYVMRPRISAFAAAVPAVATAVNGAVASAMADPTAAPTAAVTAANPLAGTTPASAITG